MAGDWIKMRNDLADDPAVISIAAQLDLEEFAVIGRLHAIWAWADEQSRDGHAVGVTRKWLDRKVQRDGFADALEKAGWLVVTNEGISIPNFENHNGETAKVRALGTRRKQRQRAENLPQKEAENVPLFVSEVSRSERDKSETREEKRREEINTKKETPSSSPKKPLPRPSRKAPAEFLVTAELQQWARANVPGVDIRFETENFRDHEFRTARCDWPAAWRQWMRTSFKALPRGGQKAQPNGSSAYDVRAARVQSFTGQKASHDDRPDQREIIDITPRTVE